jgi:hypothetical protein
MEIGRPSIDSIRKFALPGYLKLSNRDGYMGAYCIAAVIIRHYLGEDWFDRNMDPQPFRGGYLKIGQQEFTDSLVRAIRLIELAELLYNCAFVEGFGDFVNRVKTEHEVESVVAELRVARILFHGWVQFRFVVPTGKRGLDHDLEIKIADGVFAPADTKAKVEGTGLTVETIRNSLETARQNNLPKDGTGIIFLHVTQEWLVGTTGMGDPDVKKFEQRLTEVQATLKVAITNFLRTTKRVVAVVAVAFPMWDRLQLGMVLGEYKNYGHPKIGEYPISIVYLNDPCVPAPKWVNLFEEGDPSKYQSIA